MGRVTLPSPEQTDVVRQFLAESSGYHIDGIEFGKPASGLSIKATYRDFKGHTRTKRMLLPDTTDFQDAAVLMSDWLDTLSGASQARVDAGIARRKAKQDG